MLTVQELIDRLQSHEDKTAPVYVRVLDGAYFPAFGGMPCYPDEQAADPDCLHVDNDRNEVPRNAFCVVAD